MTRSILPVLLAGIAGAQELDDNYTLGRLNGPGVSAQEAIDQVRGVTGSALILDFRMGKDGTFLVDLPVAFARASKNDVSLSTYALPEIRLGMHPAEGWIADIQLTFPNMWVTTSGSESASGFENDVPRLVGTEFHLGFLSNGGRIPLSEATIPWAFLHGPIVSQGQFGISGDWNEIHVDSSKMRGYDLKGAYGAAPDVQVRAELKDTVVYGPYHLQSALLGGDWVSHAIRAGAWWSSRVDQSYFADPGLATLSDPGHGTAAPGAELFTKSRNWGFHGYGGILVGERSLTADEVAGNWNGFFSNRLGAGQILLEDTASFYPGERGARFVLGGSADYGVLDPLTAGLRYSFENDNGYTDFQAWLVATASNIPPRKTGPGQVSHMEYELGILPGAGQWAATTRWRLPFSDGHLFESYLDLEQDQLLPYTNPWQNWKLGWSRTPGQWTDFDLLALGGLTESFFAMGRISRMKYFRSDAGSSMFSYTYVTWLTSDPFLYDMKDTWVFDLGLGLHGPGWACLLDVPYSTGKGKEFPDLDRNNVGIYRQGMDSRFGPVQLTLVSIF